MIFTSGENNIGISQDTFTPHNDAIIDINSATKGIRIPQLDTIVINNMENANAMIVYDKNENLLKYNNGTKWISLRDSDAVSVDELSYIPSTPYLPPQLANDFSNISDFIKSNYTLNLEPKKTYIVSNSVNIHNITNFTINGNDAIIKTTTPIGSVCTLSGGCSKITIRDLNFNCRNISTGGFYDAVINNTDNDNMSDILFENLNIDTNQKNGIHFEDRNGDNEIYKIDGLIIKNCDILCSGSTCYGIGIRKRAENLKILDCKINLPASNSFNNLALYGGSENFIVRNCIFLGSSGHSPLAISPARYGSVIGNILRYEGTTQSTVEGGIEIEWKASHIGRQTSYDITVDGNVIENYNYGVMITRRDTRYLRPSNIVISNNIIKNSSKYDIWVDAYENINICGNTITNNSSHSSNIVINSGKQVVIANNICDNNVEGNGSVINVDTYGEGALISDLIITGNMINGIRSDRNGINMRNHSGIITNNIIRGRGMKISSIGSALVANNI